MNLFEDELGHHEPAHPDADRVWQHCLSELQFLLQEKDYRQWITPLTAELNDGVLTLLTPNMVWVKHVKEQYLAQIKALAIAYDPALVQDVRVEMVVSTTPSPKVVAQKSTAQKIKTAGAVSEGLPVEAAFTFDGFVKGKSNALAYNACNELSKKDNKHHYGPIFIYGSSGLGKTHLMHAMAHRYQKYNKRYCYFTKEHFYKTVLEAFRDSKIDQFVKNVCKADFLILDDVHMFDGKQSPKVTQILMNLFDEFSKGNAKQVVLASDRPPSQMLSFGDRNISRLSGGLLLAIEPPDMEMRVQILEKKASILNLELPRDCAIFMAQNLPPDVRGLEGALKRVQLSADVLRNEPVTMALVRDAIKDQVQARARAINAEGIRDLVAEFYQISPKDMMGKKRARNIARPRQMAMALIRELTRDSFPEIGQVFGGRDHTTVMHACEKIEELKLTDPSVEKDYHSLKMMLEYV